MRNAPTLEALPVWRDSAKQEVVVSLQREPSGNVTRRTLRRVIARRLRAWFDKIGMQPVPERLLRILFEPKHDPDIKR
jgi:hypothetical protein